MKRNHSTKKCPQCGKLFKNGITGGNNLGRASLCDGCTHTAVENFTFQVEFIGKLADTVKGIRDMGQVLLSEMHIISMTLNNWVRR